MRRWNWQEDALAEEAERSVLTRRDLLRAAAASGAALAAAAPLAERRAGGDRDGAGRRGGRLRVGHVGAGKGESFNPGRGSSFIDASRYYNLYDPLVRVRPDLTSGRGSPSSGVRTTTRPSG